MAVELKKIPCHQVIIGRKETFVDPRSKLLRKALRQFFSFDVKSIEINKIYRIYKELSKDQIAEIASLLFADEVTEEIREKKKRVIGL